MLLFLIFFVILSGGISNVGGILRGDSAGIEGHG